MFVIGFISIIQRIPIGATCINLLCSYKNKLTWDIGGRVVDVCVRYIAPRRRGGGPRKWAHGADLRPLPIHYPAICIYPNTRVHILRYSYMLALDTNSSSVKGFI